MLLILTNHKYPIGRIHIQDYYVFSLFFIRLIVYFIKTFKSFLLRQHIINQRLMKIHSKIKYICFIINTCKLYECKMLMNYVYD